MRRVVGDEAVIWLQTDGPATVRVQAGPAEAVQSTFEVEGVHLALPIVSGLPTGDTEYRVYLDERQVWPPRHQPPSLIRIGTGAWTKIAFGSCRDPKRRPDPDALEVFADEVMKSNLLPDLLALIGDQIYADEVWAFEEYVALYQAAWSNSSVRWLLSTVPTIMIFDDHEIHDDWNSSAAWVAEMSARPHWSDHIRAGLLSYWLFQHLGNLPPDELRAANPKAPPHNWNFTVDIGRIRVIMLDCRGSRVLDGPERRMFPQAQWDDLARDTQADRDHLVIACSLPWLLAPAIHHGEGLMEVLSHRFGGVMERLRRRYDLEHWAAVGHSFEELTSIIQAAGKPATVTVIGGDVHHSYVAQAFLPGRPRLLQVTCSPLNNDLSGTMRTLLRLGWSPLLSGPAALAARLAGVPRPAVRWKPLTRPIFANAIATLTFTGDELTTELHISGGSGGMASAARI
ncbi:MAG TPA: alkaline phosphatase D family protein [Candidatus Limnocylindrales bacterium]